nr:3829_t:CDS:2 [Entrophospora candida]
MVLGIDSARHKLLAIRRQEGIEEVKRKGIIIDREVSRRTYLGFCESEPRVSVKYHLINRKIEAYEVPLNPHGLTQAKLISIMDNWSDQLRVIGELDVIVAVNSSRKPYPTLVVEIASTESLRSLHELTTYFSQQTTIQIYLAIKLFPPCQYGFVALLELLYLRNNPNPTIPVIAKSFRTASLHHYSQTYLLNTVHVTGITGVGFGGVPCDDANLQEYQMAIPTTLLFNNVPGGVPQFEDEEFPSEDELFKMALASPMEQQGNKFNEKKEKISDLTGLTALHLDNDQYESDYLSDFDADKDEALNIPGELVLAYSMWKFYPAKIVGYEKPNKYHVVFCDGSKRTLKRKKFYTLWQKGFKTYIVMENENPDYRDPELITAIQELEPILSKVLLGDEKSAWRYQNFVEGGKRRRLLASHVSQGPFNNSEFGLILKVLRHMYVPEVAKAIDKTDFIEPSELIKSMETHRFVNDVLVPETIIRLIMKSDELSYEEADLKMTDGYEDLSWIIR